MIEKTKEIHVTFDFPMKEHDVLGVVENRTEIKFKRIFGYCPYYTISVREGAFHVNGTVKVPLTVFSSVSGYNKRMIDDKRLAYFEGGIVVPTHIDDTGSHVSIVDKEGNTKIVSVFELDYNPPEIYFKGVDKTKPVKFINNPPTSSFIYKRSTGVLEIDPGSNPTIDQLIEYGMAMATEDSDGKVCYEHEGELLYKNEPEKVGDISIEQFLQKVALSGKVDLKDYFGGLVS